MMRLMMTSADDEINSVGTNFHALLLCQADAVADNSSNITVHGKTSIEFYLVRARAVHFESTWVKGQGE